MCLDRITQRHDPPTTEIEVAYKVYFSVPVTPLHLAPPPDGLYPVFMFEDDDQMPKVGAWQQAVLPDNSEQLLSAEGYHNSTSYYPAGFHCYGTLKAAEHSDWYTGFPRQQPKIARVEIRGIRTRGLESTNRGDMFPVFVADEMRIVEVLP